MKAILKKRPAGMKWFHKAQDVEEKLKATLERERQ